MAANDLLTLPEARLAVRVNTNDTTNVTILTAVVTAVSLAIDGAAGPVVRRTVTSERHDGGCPSIWLRQSPVYAVSSVTEYTGTTGATLTDETAGTSPALGYQLEPYSRATAPYSGRVFRRSGGSDTVFSAGRGNVVVTYTGGRFESTTNVSELFKTAARITLENVWQQYREGTAVRDEFETPITAFPRFGIPNGARQLLDAAGEWHDDPVLVG